MTARWRPITTAPHGARANVGGRGRRRRRSRLRSLGRTRPDSTRRHRAHRTTPMGGWTLGMADSWGDGSSVRAAPITEDDGKEVVDEDDSCVEIASVTSACRRARKLACRLRPEARPSGERPYTRLAARCFVRRRNPAQGAHCACNEAHPPQKTFTSAQPKHRPNRPSTRKPPSQGGAGRRGRSTAPSSTAGALLDALATKARVFRPEPSPTPTCAPYVVDALDGDDDVK